MNVGWTYLLLVGIISSQIIAQTVYTSPDMMLKTLYEWQKVYPSLMKISNLTDIVPQKTEQTNILVVKLSASVGDDRPVPNKLVIAGLDPSELLPIEIAFRFIMNVQRYLTDPVIHDLLDKNQIFVIFNPNPDGTNEMWKKNGVIHKNANGVYLNRNFPVGFNSLCSRDLNIDSNFFQGNTSASEIQVISLIDLMNFYQFTSMVHLKSASTRSFSVPSGCVADLISPRATRIGLQVIQGMHLNESFNMVSTHGAGGITLYSQNTYGTLALDVAVEASASLWEPMSSIGVEESILTAVLLEFLARQPHVTLQVSNLKNRPVTANVKFLTQDTTGKSNGNHFGIFNAWVLSPGTSEIQLSSPGYQDLQTEIILFNLTSCTNTAVVMNDSTNEILAIILFSSSCFIALMVFLCMSVNQTFDIMHEIDRKAVSKFLGEFKGSEFNIPKISEKHK